MYMGANKKKFCLLLRCQEAPVASIFRRSWVQSPMGPVFFRISLLSQKAYHLFCHQGSFFLEGQRYVVSYPGTLNRYPLSAHVFNFPGLDLFTSHSTVI